MELTVAVCTYNPDEGTLRRALDAIIAQVDSTPATEVIVIDNNSSPRLVEQQYLADYQVNLIREPRPGLTAAREAVINNASGAVILFVDDDNILHPNYLSGVVTAFTTDSELGLLGGRILPEYDARPPVWFGEFEHWLAVRYHSPELHVEITAPPFSSYFPVGAGLAVRRGLASAYLDDCAETLRIEGRRGDELSSGEDLDLGLFVLSQKYKLAVSGALCLTHVLPKERTSLEYIERLAVGNVKSALTIEGKWSSRFGVPIYSIFTMSSVSLVTRAIATRILSPWSARYKIKYRIYKTLIRVRLSRSHRA